MLTMKQHICPSAFVLRESINEGYEKEKKEQKKRYYIGPHFITKHCGRGIYSLQGVSDPDYIIPKISDAQLKPYIDQPDDMRTFHKVIIDLYHC